MTPESNDINEYAGGEDSDTLIDSFEDGKRERVTGENEVSDTDDEIECLDKLLGKRLVDYSHKDGETMLKFEDGTILQWNGYYNLPLDADEKGLREIWEEGANWVVGEGDEQ